MRSKELIVIGDRVLVKLDDEEKRTEVGLYLPDTVRDKEEVVGGTIVKTGRGAPLVEPNLLLSGAWGDADEVNVRYIPMQARTGDYALFMKKAAIEVQYDNENYHVVPQGAILLLMRDHDQEPTELSS